MYEAGLFVKSKRAFSVLGVTPSYNLLIKDLLILLPS